MSRLTRRPAFEKYDRGQNMKDITTARNVAEFWRGRRKGRKSMKSVAVIPWVRILCSIDSNRDFAEAVAEELGLTPEEFERQRNDEFRRLGSVVYSLRVFLDDDPEIVLPEKWKLGY